MTPHFDPNHYHQLRERVLHEADIKDIIPSDCRSLSLTIFNKINKRISETTLKRIYGFAHAEFKPSLFTINALAEYCGYANWLVYQKEIMAKTFSTFPEQRQWQQIVERTNEITRTTLQVLKNKCGIPYERTIRRHFMSDHFDAFFKEEAIATALLAPAGYGKTIALCHWIDEFTQQNYIPGQRDIILFFSGSALINAYESGHNLNNWLMALLGLDPNNYLNNLFLPDSGFDGWFYLIIDGLDEVYYKGYQFANIFEQLNDIVLLHNKTHRLKIITTMRSATWCNNEHHIINKEHWFKGFAVDGNNCKNVPLMDRFELQKLAQRLEPAGSPQVSDLAVKTLGLPIFFQYYFKKNNSVQNLGEFDEADEFDVISAYVLAKIYKSKHSIDMITFIREFLVYLDHQNKVYNISKLKINGLIKSHHHAYEELINIGYLENVNESRDSQLTNYVRFSSPKLMEHALAKKLYFDNAEVFDEKLLRSIRINLYDECQQVTILKWCIYHTISAGKTVDFKILSCFETTLSQKSDLIAFVSKLLQRFTVGDTLLNDNHFGNQISEYFVGLEYANVNYEHALRTLLTFNLTAKDDILLKCSLSVIAILELDIQKLEKLTDDMRDYPAECFASFAIDPLVCLDTILYYLKYGIVKREAFVELTKFCFNPPAAAFSTKKNSFNEVLFMLAIHTLIVCKNPAKTLRFIKVLNKVYPNGSAAYKFLLDVCTIDALLASYKIDEALKAFRMVSEKFEEEQHGFTALMKVYFKALKVKITSLQGDGTEFVTLIRSFTKMCDEYSYKLLKITSLAFTLNMLSATRNDADGTFDNLYFDMVRTARASGCRTESFYQSKDYDD